MIGRQNRSQGELFFIAGTLGDLVPDGHVLKGVDGVLDLSWLREEVRDCYDERLGRPSIDPESAVRLMLAGFFEGIVEDRKLMRAAEVNIAMRWFAGYKLTERLPDHSSLTRIRKRWGAERFRRIMERTVDQCVAAGLVDGETVHTDATLIRANVSWQAVREEHIERVLAENEASDEVPGADPPPDEPPRRGRPPGKTVKAKKKKLCTTDPDATLAKSRTHAIAEPSYKQHSVVDDKAGVVLDVVVTTGEAAESEQLQGQLKRVEQKTGKKVKTATADSGYGTASNYAALEARGIEAVIPPPRKGHHRGVLHTERFKYDAKHDLVRCPRSRILRRKNRVKNGWLYRPRAKDCKTCPLRSQCTRAKSGVRTILIVDDYPALARARRRWPNRNAATRHAYTRHRWRVEGIHGEAKTQHGLRRAVRRGLWNVAIQAYLTAAVLNLKRLAALLCHILAAWCTRRGRQTLQGVIRQHPQQIGRIGFSIPISARRAA